MWTPPSFRTGFRISTSNTDIISRRTYTIDPETRICTVGLEGPAEWILRFIQSNAEEGLIKHLKDEAAFDRLVAGFNDKPKDTTGEEND